MAYQQVSTYILHLDTNVSVSAKLATVVSSCFKHTSILNKNNQFLTKTIDSSFQAHIFCFKKLMDEEPTNEMHQTILHKCVTFSSASIDNDSDDVKVDIKVAQNLAESVQQSYDTAPSDSNSRQSQQKNIHPRLQQLSDATIEDKDDLEEHDQVSTPEIVSSVENNSQQNSTSDENFEHVAQEQITKKQSSINAVKSQFFDAVEEFVEDLDLPEKQKESIPQCCSYFVFVVIYTIMAILNRSWSSEIFYQTSIVTELVTGGSVSDEEDSPFLEVKTVSDMWNYIENDLLNAIMVETDYNGDFITDENQRYLIGGQVRVLGGVRLRMFRIENQICTYGKRNDVNTEPVKFSCAYNRKKEYTDDIILNDGTVLKHTSSEHLAWKDVAFSGFIESYPASGYIVDLPLNLTKAKLMVQNLQASKNFITTTSRLLLVDFNAFNPNTGIHTVARIAYENTKTGGVLPSFEIKSWRFLRYDFVGGILLIIATILFFICVCHFTYEFVYAIKRKQDIKKYLNEDAWRYVDLINVIFFWATIIIKIFELIHRSNVDFLNKNEFVSLQCSTFLVEFEMYVSMVNGFLVWIKMFKYLSFSKRLTFLFLILRRSSTDFIVFGFVILVFVCAFGMSGFLVFSPDVRDFRTFQHAFANLIRYIVSDMNFEELSHSNSLVGSFFYTIWTILMLLIMSNVFIAILSNSYDAISNQFDESEGIKSIFGYDKLVDGVRKTQQQARSTLLRPIAMRRQTTAFKIGKKFRNKNKNQRKVFVNSAGNLNGILKKSKDAFNSNNENNNHGRHSVPNMTTKSADFNAEQRQEHETGEGKHAECSN